MNNRRRSDGDDDDDDGRREEEKRERKGKAENGDDGTSSKSMKLITAISEFLRISLPLPFLPDVHMFSYVNAFYIKTKV